MFLEKKTSVSWLALGLGVVAGMRSMAPAALLSLARGKKHSSLDRGLVGLAALEFLGDKIPAIPRRTATLPLSGRALSGALAGIVLAKKSHGSVWIPALIGAGAAVASSFVFAGVRELMTEKLHVPKFAAALMEDAAAVQIGRAVVRAQS